VTEDSSRSVTLRLDEDLRDLIPGFIANKRADARSILLAADRGDFEGLEKVGHRIKGEGGSYGLDRISELGAEIEAAATNRDAAAIRRCAANITSYLDSLNIVYE
jgi:HPt (histidine-containing phosphotransfer) domain-containing protein